MTTISSTPFNGYREEQISFRLMDYFIRPNFFSKLEDTRPKLLYGSRGTGKTTLLKALAIDYSENKTDYLREKQYIGIYYRIDLNVATAFKGNGISEKQWYKLYSYYFACNLSYNFLKEIALVKDQLRLNEEKICKEISIFFTCVNEITSFDNIISQISSELNGIEKYVNNIPFRNFPEIGNYSKIVADIPKIVFENSSSEFSNGKFVIYSIDEFEGLSLYQQKAVLSLLKYSDKFHTFIIGMRPFGLKELVTTGNEYIRETDDVKSIIIDDLLDYEKFAYAVCNKRLELFYKKYFPKLIVPTVDAFFGKKSEENEIEHIFKDAKRQELHIKRVKDFFNSFGFTNENEFSAFFDNHEEFYLLILKLIKLKNQGNVISRDIILKQIQIINENDKKSKNFSDNYRMAILYYVLHLYSVEKDYSGFQTLVNLSGKTIRYLFELCDEILWEAGSHIDNLYASSHKVSREIQSKAVWNVSKRRVNQIGSVPNFGPSMRQFIISFGNICLIYHEDSGIRKWEPNHFCIKADDEIDKKVSDFLSECVFRGVLIQYADNKIKVKGSIASDQNMYQIHPIYTPNFQISWRKKQKVELSNEDLEILISGNTRKINNLINKVREESISNKNDQIINYLKGKTDKKNNQSDLQQIKLFEEL